MIKLKESWELSSCLEQPNIVADELNKQGIKPFKIEVRKDKENLRAIKEEELIRPIIIIDEEAYYSVADYTEVNDIEKIKIKKLDKPMNLLDEEGNNTIPLLENDYLKIEAIYIKEEAELTVDETSFHSLIITEGMGYILSSREKMTLAEGDSIFMPANYGTYCIDGKCNVIFSRLK